MSDSDPSAELREAALAFDASALGELIERGTLSSADRGFAEAWIALVVGDASGAMRLAEVLEAEARRANDAARVVECAALRALAQVESGDLEEATTLARRASRMGRTEAIFEPECLAHLVLARVRRLNGFPHLATRILRSLWERTPTRFYAWLGWELWMAGARERGFLLEVGAPPLHRAAAALENLLAAADADDAGAYRAAAAELERAASSLSLIRSEARALLETNDPDATFTAEDVAAFAEGRSDDVPAALHGIITRDGAAPADETAIAYVLARPGRPARRITRLGWVLLERSTLRQLTQSRRKQGRNETIIAALALAGARGLSEAELFEMAYEFRYVPETHANSFGVALHRARKYVEPLAVIHHASGRLVLEAHEPFVVPDPRCKKPIKDKLLCAVADQRGASPGDIAKAVGVSLRVAQAALAGLSAEGGCVARKSGRELVYEVEDTTFSEPTQLRSR
ncbi:MAG: hypothetical protein AB7S26_16650 [Sandaracinaceae bacterium]